MRVCVCTIVHHPEDARILHRQIRALLDAGHEVTYIAPFRACNVTPWRNIHPVDVPRATGRNRLRAIRAARAVLARHAPYSDVVLLHDPELLLAIPRKLRRRTVVWDVHEDTAAALSAKGWVPRPLLPLLRPAVRYLEARTERRHRLLLAEEGYRSRFEREHPVVPNTTYVSDTAPDAPDGRRVVYVGHLSMARGAGDMIEVARRLHGEGITVELIGAADADVRVLLREAQLQGILRWYGFVPNDRALRIAEGAMAGLALLHDEPNYRHSMPTKVIEYMARGIPVITTPNPPAVDLIGSSGAGLIVDFEQPDAAADAVRRLRDDAELRTELGRRGYETARARFHWPVQAERFVARLEYWARATADGAAEETETEPSGEIIGAAEHTPNGTSLPA
ncbi:glycosyltransferase family 4 protein [Actinomadura alba]|uniref:Glycosyltransferase family 4 protein n=1 Tax=Actinomadura alba TaxID=406431 RepID=A0ABR7LJ06_9ACTN|nr:glycosyltransferase family 4 protein [Actinomadura alba]MBC6464768.1 glycosyltransferase family 4 protein [Actinomadura alba]